MARSPIKANAFQHLELLQQVVAFKDKFYHSGWSHYLEAKPKTLKLLPPQYSMQPLKDDYKKMLPMIYADTLTFEEIMDSLAILEQEINSLR